MALAEGLRRIRRIGKGILWTGFVFVAIAVGLRLLNVLTPNIFLSPGFMIFGVIGIYLSILGVIVLLVEWIAEGFLLAPRVPPNP
jgi:hypothetical protein